MDLGNSGAHKFSVSLESKVRNKETHQFFSSVSLFCVNVYVEDGKNGAMFPDSFS